MILSIDWWECSKTRKYLWNDCELLVKMPSRIYRESKKHPFTLIHFAMVLTFPCIWIGDNSRKWITICLFLTLKLVEQALTDAQLTKNDINRILLVGGSTRIPKIQAILTEFFNGKELDKTINPDEAVAHEAAIQPHTLLGMASNISPPYILKDVTPLSLGVDILCKRKHKKELITSVIIKRNTQIPVSNTMTYKTTESNQTFFRFRILQGEAISPATNYVSFLLTKFLQIRKALKKSTSHFPLMPVAY